MKKLDFTRLTILGLITIFVLSTGFAYAEGRPIALRDGQNQSLMEEGTIDLKGINPDQLSLSVDGAVDYDTAITAGAAYLRHMQADITEDNAGNGNPDNPDDPDDGGWDWSSQIFTHSTSASPTNIYGVTALGIYYHYLLNGGVGYLLAMTDAADTMIYNPNVRSGSDLIFLMNYNDLSGVSGIAYKDSARAKYDARIATYGSAQAFAEYIRDVRGVTQGYANGIIAWDIGIWVRVAAMLDVRYPGNGYDSDADAMAEVIYQDSYMDNPGLFDIIDDQGFDPDYNDYNYYWYNLGITGLIDAFDAAGVHTSEIPGLVAILLDGQANHGGISYCYGAGIGDDDWQSTAYAMMTLGRLDQSTYQTALNKMGYFLAATQDPSGAWVYSSGNHYPEIGGECVAGLYYTSSAPYTLADAIVDANFAWQGDVDVYNNAHGTGYIWGYDAFATIQEAIDAVEGSTVHVVAGTYSESPYIDKSLNLLGDGSATTFIAGGIQIGGSFDGLVIDGFTLSGDAAGYKDAVIDSRPTTGPVSDITVSNCVLDGESLYNRYCFYGNFITGDWTFDGNEIKNFVTWYVLDNTGSNHDVPYAMDAVYFTNNYVHDCGGSIAFRGKVDEPTAYALIAGNTMEDYIASASSEVWAAIEINNVTSLEVYNNNIHDVPEVSWGGEGQALQIWSATPWSVDIHDNDFSGNFQGMYIWALLEDGLWSGGDTPLYIPAGSIYHNDFSGTADFGIWISDLPVGSGSSSAIGGPLDAEENYWGPFDFASIDALNSAGVDFDPWCLDAAFTKCDLTEIITDTWADDDWAGSTPGDIVGGHVFGYDAFATIQEAVDAVNGSTVHINNGTYVTTLDINKDLTMIGESEAGVIIDCSSFSDYGLYVSGDYTVDFSYFTLIGPLPAAYGYGLKISGDNAQATLNHITVKDCGRSGFDMNGLVYGDLQNLTALDNGGVGLALTDCSNITVANITTSGNAWGGMAVYTMGNVHTGGSDNVTLTGTNSFGESNPFYTETGGGFPITNLNISTSEFPYTVHNIVATAFTLYSPDLTTAVTGAAGWDVQVTTPSSYVLDRVTGEYYVGPGMTIAVALGAASAGDTINLLAGTYPEALTITLNGLSIIGENSSTVIISPPAGTATNNASMYVTADNVTLKSFSLVGVAPSSTPRYGLKFGQVTGGTLEDVEITNVYRSGLDMLGADGLLIKDVYSHNNGGNGIQGADLRNVTFENITTANNAWGGVGIFTWGQYTPIGVYGVVFTGSNSFGETGADVGSIYFEEGNYTDPGNPYPITYSTNILDGADVTLQLSDVTHLLTGNSDNDNYYTRFYATLADAQAAAAGAVSHILDGRFIRELDGNNMYVPANDGSIKAAIDASNSGDIIHAEAGAYAEGPQIVVDNNVTVLGATSKSLVTVTPTASTGSSGDARGWFLVLDGIDFTLSDVTLDGSGFDIYQAVRSHGGGTYTNVDFHNITYPGYAGTALAAFGSLNVTLNGCDFANIGRVGALLYGAGLTDSYFLNSTYAGKGDGDWLDYAADISAGAVVTLSGNTVSNCTGVASSDGSTSAGFLVTTYYGTGTTAYLEGNYVTGCTTGIAIGYDDTDASTVVMTNDNEFIGNDYGVTTTTSTAISLTAHGNVFLNTVNAQDNAGGTWDDGVSLGNCWSDYSGTGTYAVGGTAGSVDNYPSADCASNMGPDFITYLCSGSLSFTVDIGASITGMKSGSYTFAFPYSLNFDGVTALASNATIAPPMYYDNASGYDSVTIDIFNNVGSGTFSGPLTLFSVQLSGADDICTGDLISMIGIDLRDLGNLPIPAPLASPISLIVDCEDPVFATTTTAGGYYNAPPVLDISASDNCDIDALYYQIDACTGGGWTAIAGPGYSGASYTNTAWAMSATVFNALADNSNHCIYFRVEDDNGRYNADECSFSWCFNKDVTPPDPPTDFVALPGHEKCKLSWINPGGDPSWVGVEVRRNPWSVGAYPEYDDFSAAIGYPSNETEGDLVVQTTLEAYRDSANTTAFPRNVYYYTIFSYDIAGNYSTATVAQQDRATNYWLGDFDAAQDGLVYFSDLTVLSTTYGLTSADGGYLAKCDIGPTMDDPVFGIPTTDNLIAFEDLAIFAIVFDSVTANQKIAPIFPESPYVDRTGVRIEQKVEDRRLTVELYLDNGNADAKSVFTEIGFDPAELKYIGTNRGSALQQSKAPIFFKALDDKTAVSVSAAVMGNGLSFDGSGLLAQMEFEILTADRATIQISDADIRDNGNNRLLSDGTTYAPITISARVVPDTYELSQNHPNPFNPDTEIDFAIPVETNVRLTIYNISGQVVKTLLDEVKPVGSYTVRWNGTNESGETVASGVYFYRLETADFQKTVKMVLMK